MHTPLGRVILFEGAGSAVEMLPSHKVFSCGRFPKGFSEPSIKIILQNTWTMFVD